MVATQKLKGYALYWLWYLKKARFKEGKSKIKTSSKLKVYLDLRFHNELLFEEEILQRENSLWSKKRSRSKMRKVSSFWFSWKYGGRQLDYGWEFPQSSQINDYCILPHIEETIEVQIQQVEAIEHIPLEEKISLRFSIIPLGNKPQ